MEGVSAANTSQAAAQPAPQLSGQQAAGDRLQGSSIATGRTLCKMDLDPVMEVERPLGYFECISGQESWDALGMIIKWTKPQVNEESIVYMLDELELRVCVECKKPVPLRDLTAYAWTCFFHKDNIEGIYREIPLAYDEKSRKWNDVGVTTYEFAAKVFPTHLDEYRLTFNIKFRDNMIWANVLKDDHMLTVTFPREVNEWTQYARSIKIVDNLHIGNYIAIMLAEEMNYDAVLNLHSGIDDEPSIGRVVKKVQREILPLGGGMEIQTEKVLDNLHFDNYVAIMLAEEMNYDAVLNLHSGIDDEPSIGRVVKKVQRETLPLGGGVEIQTDKIANIVNWLKHATVQFEKILVGDREGLGRVGTALTAYIFANNLNLTFEEAYQLVMSRTIIYCHKGLQHTLYNMYPRD